MQVAVVAPPGGAWSRPGEQASVKFGAIVGAGVGGGVGLAVGATVGVLRGAGVGEGRLVGWAGDVEPAVAGAGSASGAGVEGEDEGAELGNGERTAAA